MRELIDKIKNEFDDNYGWIRIVDADWVSDDLRLSISVQYGDDNLPELWEIECSGVVEERITSELSESIRVSEDSPLLIPYKEMEADVVFSENRIESNMLLGIVFSVCFEIFGRPEYVERFLNMKPTSSGICSASYGLLGKFPESVANVILEKLRDQPIKIKKLLGRLPKYWNGSEHVEYPELKILEIGKSYVVAKYFSAVRA